MECLQTHPWVWNASYICHLSNALHKWISKERFSHLWPMGLIQGKTWPTQCSWLGWGLSNVGFGSLNWDHEKADTTGENQSMWLIDIQLKLNKWQKKINGNSDFVPFQRTNFWLQSIVLDFIKLMSLNGLVILSNLYPWRLLISEVPVHRSEIYCLSALMFRIPWSKIIGDYKRPCCQKPAGAYPDKERVLSFWLGQ